MDEPSYEPRSFLQNNWFWVYNRNIHTLEGLYVVLDANAEGISALIEMGFLERSLQNSVERKGVLFSNDGLVRFAPKDRISYWEHDYKFLPEEGSMIANFGVEGARLFGDVARTFERNSVTFGLNVKPGESPIQKVFGIGIGNFKEKEGLVFSSDLEGLNGKKCAFAISKG